MQKSNIYLLATTLILMGCTNKQSAIKPIILAQKNSKIQMVKTQKMGISLSEIKQTGAFSNIALKAKKSYALNESIQFVIDTGEAEGYLYLIYLNNKGETGLLYPNANAPLSEMGGSFLFPKDFGNMNIRATKDCKDCPKEKTTIYAILSKTPIIDIKNITQDDLLNLTSPKTKNRAISLELGNNTKNDSNLHVGKVNFFVE